MDTSLDWQVAQAYRNPAQQARVVTERWVAESAYCPSCGSTPLRRYANNRPVADFRCPSCREEFELKSQRERFGAKIVDGSYETMMTRLVSNANPSLLLLSYDPSTASVLNFIVVPKAFFVPTLIERRKPLAPTSRRAGWVGCNIRLSGVPALGRINIVRDGVAESKESVLTAWRQTMFLREERDASARDWLMSVIACIERLESETFTLAELYGFERELSEKHPNNRHVRAKIRQQLQILRDRGYLEFFARGRYRRA